MKLISSLPYRSTYEIDSHTSYELAIQTKMPQLSKIKMSEKYLYGMLKNLALTSKDYR